VELEIVPEPDPAERHSITEAVAADLIADFPPSAWWRRGVRENLDDEAPGPLVDRYSGSS
jgi:hypothetical protein